jgi:hypothetical protein
MTTRQQLLQHGKLVHTSERIKPILIKIPKVADAKSCERSWLCDVEQQQRNDALGLMYQTIIANLRNAGLNMPLVLDASDCGQHLNLWKSILEQLYRVLTQNTTSFFLHILTGQVMPIQPPLSPIC